VKRLYNKGTTGTVLKRLSRGKLHKTNRVCPDQVHSDQMVLRTVRQKVGTREMQPKTFKTKLTQGGP
jgi:hypothetical protein